MMPSSPATMQANDTTPSLHQLEGSRRGQIYRLTPGEHWIGRDEGASIRVDGPDASRRHALLTVRADGIEAQDLGSKNGIFVDGERVEERTMLAHGARLRVGDAIFEVHHAGAQVSRALSRAGEATVTRTLERGDDPSASLSLAWPLLATLFFASVAALLFWS